MDNTTNTPLLDKIVLPGFCEVDWLPTVDPGLKRELTAYLLSGEFGLQLAAAGVSQNAINRYWASLEILKDQDTDWLLDESTLYEGSPCCGATVTAMGFCSECKEAL